MKEKELRKMKRIELLDIIYALQENEEKLQAEKAELEKQLANKVIKIENEGSIAEAAMAISGIMQVAQDTADQYLQSVYEANKDAKAKADKMMEDAQIKSEEMIATAREKAEAMIKAADSYYESITATARAAEKKAEEICMEARKQTAVFMIETNGANNSGGSERVNKTASQDYRNNREDNTLEGVEVIDV